MRRLGETGYRMAVLAAVLLAFALRVTTLAERALWFDEAMEYWVASSNLPTLQPSVGDTLQDSPLYSLLLHLWLAGTHHEFWLRFLSTILSMVGMVGVIVMARDMSGRVTAVTSAVLAAVSHEASVSYRKRGTTRSCWS